MPPPAPAYAQPKIRQVVLEAVFRRKRLFWSAVLAVVALVAVITFTMPKKYQAEAKLMVQNVRSSSPLTTAASDRLISSNTVPPEQISTQVEMLQSAAVSRRATGGAPSGRTTTAQDKAAENLRKALSVDAVHQTNLINLKMLGNSPRDAEEQLQRVVDAYFAERSGSGTSSGAASFFDDQLRYKQSQLQTDQQKLTDFQMEQGISDLDEAKRLQMARIASLQNDYLSAEAQLAAQRSKAATDRDQLRSTPPRSKTTERSITNQYSQERFGTELVDLENKLTELRKRYPETDRQVVETREKLETVKRAEANARSNPAGEQATDVNPVYQQLSASVAVSAGEASARAAQAAKISEQLKAAQARLQNLNQATARFDELKRNVAEAQRDFDVYAQKRDEARVSEELDKARMFDVSLVQPPIASSAQVRPRPKLYMAAGLVFGIMLGTLLALYADISSEAIFLPSQLDTLVGLRSMATVADEWQEGAASANSLAYRKILLGMRNALRHKENERAVRMEREQQSLSHGSDAPKKPVSPLGSCVAFVAPLRGEGTTFIVRHLAEEAVQHASYRVVVIDAAILLRQFAAKGDAGFSLQEDERHGYWVLDPDPESEGTAQRSSRGTSLQEIFSWRLRPLMMQLREDFDYIFIDCPGLSESTLSGELDRVVDGYVGVVGAGFSRKQNIDGMAAMFEEASAPVLGYVLTRREYPLPQWLHRML